MNVRSSGVTRMGGTLKLRSEPREVVDKLNGLSFYCILSVWPIYNSSANPAILFLCECLACRMLGVLPVS